MKQQLPAVSQVTDFYFEVLLANLRCMTEVYGVVTDTLGGSRATGPRDNQK